MDLKSILEQVLYTIGNKDVLLGELIVAIILLAVLAVFYRLTMRKWLPLFYRKEKVLEQEQSKTTRLIKLFFFLLSALSIIAVTGLDFKYDPFDADEDPATGGIWFFSTLLIIFLIFLVARVFDWAIYRTLQRNFQLRREAIQKITVNFEQPKLLRPPRQIVQPVIFIMAILFLVNLLDLNSFFSENFQLGSGENSDTINIGPSEVISAILVLYIARLVNWMVTELFLFPYYQRKEINIGSQYAINQLFRYFLYVFAILIALQAMDINFTILLGGAAALLVGIGLGLQQTFNDLISGIILLTERSVEIGDVLDFGTMVGTVRSIGLRTSLVETRDNTTIIVPNSKLIGDIITNWSHDEDKARFRISVGVAYGSDTALVKKILLQVAQEHPKALKRPAPFVRFINFGDSSLDFELHFWSKEFLRIEDVKSDLRFETDRLFRENNITIPFPQRDVWMR